MSATDAELEDIGLLWDHDLVSEDNDYFEVSGLEDDMVKADSGELVAPGLSRCLGVAVYDSSSEVGYAAHFTTQSRTPEELSEFLSDFNTLLMMEDLDYDNSEIMVAGIDYEEDIAGTVSDDFLGETGAVEAAADQGAKRGIAEEYARRYFADSNICWEVEDGKTSSIVMDIDEGVLEYNSAYDDR